MDFIGRVILKVKEKMPLEAFLFVMQHILFAVFALALFGSIMTSSVMTPGLFGYILLLILTPILLFLFFAPIVSIGQNIIQNRKDVRKVLCCVPLLIVGIFQTISVVLGYAKFMTYGSGPDSLLYALLFPILSIAEATIYPITEKIFYMGFPYNCLPSLIFYLIILPTSLLIYLLPSVDYESKKITKEMKLIVLLPFICAAIPVIVHTLKMRLGLIDELMIQFFWLEIASDIQLMGFLLLMPLLSILYVRHYKRTKERATKSFA